MLKATRTLAAGLLCLATLTAAAEWPEKPVKIVVPFPPGSMGDVVARLMSPGLSARLGQPIVVENKPGAGGNIGSAAVANAPADGYTLLVGATNNFVINQFLYKNLGYDPLTRLEPVSVLVDVPSVLFTSGAVPANNYAEFARWARASNGAANYASPGNGTTPHLSMVAIDKASGLRMVHVPYQGAAPAMQALLANDVQAYLVGAGIGVPHVRAGKIKAIAVSSAQRLPVLPDTPTFAEAGMPEVKASNWWGLAAPHGTPESVVNRLAAEIRTVLGERNISDRLTGLGVVANAEGPKSMKRQLEEESKMWARAVGELGIKLD
jgi:tripartite-type tricarboxylate transporter receptor subunit TctC